MDSVASCSDDASAVYECRTVTGRIFGVGYALVLRHRCAGPSGVIVNLRVR